MARKRVKDTREPGKKIVIFCEGRKSEPNYFNGLKQTLRVHKNRLIVEIVDCEYTSCVELVNEANKKKRTKRYVKEDEFWVVVDKDGYTQHAKCFDIARGKGVKIAFSAIAFEFWILLHFEYTSRVFQNSAEIISYIKTVHDFSYEKNMGGLYMLLQDREVEAKGRAQKIRQHHDATSPGQQPYRLDPYTDVDKLVESIQNSSAKSSARKDFC